MCLLGCSVASTPPVDGAPPTGTLGGAGDAAHERSNEQADDRPRESPVPDESKPAPPRPALMPVEQLRALDLGTRLGTYQARDAEWVGGQPVVVNRDYDFQLAMSMHYRVGPALAASRRQEANRELAQQVEKMRPIVPAELFAELERRCEGRCPELHAETARLYAVLYGTETARLRVVLETDDPRRGSLQLVSVGSPHAATEFASEGLLRSELDRGLGRLHALLSEVPSTPTELGDEATLGRCRVGGTESVDGQVIGRSGDNVVMALRASPSPARAACPTEAFLVGQAPSAATAARAPQP